MKRIALSLLIALSAFAVQAQSPAEPVEGVVAGAEAEAEAEAAVEAEALAKRSHDRRCLRDTGTRLKHRDRHGCNGQVGESYTGEELRNTGASSTADALRTLSPRVGG